MRFASVLLPFVCAFPAQFAFAEGEALLVKTAEMDIAAGVAQSFAIEMAPEMPALSEGQYYVVAVSADGALTVTTAAGQVGMIELTAKPGLLMDIYADQLAGFRMMGSMIASQAAMQGGADEAQINDMIGKVFDFPKQIETLGITVRGDETAGFKGGIELVPAKDSGFASFVNLVKPGAVGAPILGDGKAAVQAYASVDKTALSTMVEHILAFSAAMGGDNSFQKTWESLKGNYDGSGAFVLTGDETAASMIGAFGVSDAAAINALYSDAEFRKSSEQAAAQNTQAKTTMTWDAYEHRGVKVHQMVTEIPDAEMMGPNPMLKDGKIATEIASAGSLFVMTMNGGDAATKSMLDQALDDKVARKELPANTVFVLQLKLRELVAQMGGGPDAGDAPENVFVDVGANQGAFRIGFQIK